MTTVFQAVKFNQTLDGQLHLCSRYINKKSCPVGEDSDVSTLTLTLQYVSQAALS